MAAGNVNNPTTAGVNYTQAAASSAGTDKTVLGKDDFLKLLITQLQNQDPTQPMDDTQTVAQMAQFSSLEQMTQLNDSFTKFSQAQAMGTYSNIIGKHISWTETTTQGTGDQATTTSVSKNGIVSSIQMKNGTAQAVLADGSQVDVTNIESISLADSAAASGQGTSQ
jgi:flagellar basal-body rod modification protein FlgD